MSPVDHFGVDYADARRRFLGRCAAAGIEVEHRLHPERGHRGEELAVDCARLGPWDAPRVFLTLSATHGVEGFCGSGVQAGALASGLYEPLPPGVAVVLIHAVNPHGFSWLRRVDHENVDLNRNHIDHRRPRPANPGYELLKDAICPAAWTAEARQAAGARLAAYAARHGAMALRTAVSGGQYSHAEGLFFGGRAPCWSARRLAEIAARHAGRARHVAVIDYHTGLGPYGHGELISDHGPAEPGHARLLAWLGAGEVTSTADGSAVSAPLTGTNARGLERACPRATFTMATAEFGTRPMVEVLDSLRADGWLHHHGEVASDEGRAIKAEIRRCFYPDADDWKRMVWRRAAAVERAMIAGLAALD